MKAIVIVLCLLSLGYFNISATEQDAEKKEEKQEEKKKAVYFIPLWWGNDVFRPETKNTSFYYVEPLYHLHATAAKSGYDLRVADPGYNYLHDPHNRPISENIEAVVVFEVADFQLNYLKNYPRHKLNLILWEPPTTMPINYSPENHEIFSRVYTWRDDLVDNKKYFKIYYPVLRPMLANAKPFEERKLCTFVGGNKSSGMPNELYHERRSIIDFFEQNHTDDFEFYGGGWPQTLKTYKGAIEGSTQGKVETLQGYKFAFAYENGKNIPGYITEKIFDCFTAGVVPIYLGAPNVTAYIPKNCFIAREDFQSNEELYNRLKGMSKEEYLGYIKNIQDYLASQEAQVFSTETFIKIIMDMLEASSSHQQISKEESPST